MLTCAGVPGLDEAPYDGAALVAGLLDALAPLLGEAMLQQHPEVRLLPLRLLVTMTGSTRHTAVRHTHTHTGGAPGHRVAIKDEALQHMLHLG